MTSVRTYRSSSFVTAWTGPVMVTLPAVSRSAQEGPTQSSISPGSTIRRNQASVKASRVVGTSNRTSASPPG